MGEDAKCAGATPASSCRTRACGRQPDDAREHPRESRGGLDAKRKLQEIAAKDLGGSPDDYDVGGERVFRRGNPARGMSFAQAAGARFSLAGSTTATRWPNTQRDDEGLCEGARRAWPDGGRKGRVRREGATYSFVTGFAEVEVDVETGKVL